MSVSVVDVSVPLVEVVSVVEATSVPNPAAYLSTTARSPRQREALRVKGKENKKGRWNLRIRHGNASAYVRRGDLHNDVQRRLNHDTSPGISLIWRRNWRRPQLSSDGCTYTTQVVSSLTTAWVVVVSRAFLQPPTSLVHDEVSTSRERRRYYLPPTLTRSVGKAPPSHHERLPHALESRQLKSKPGRRFIRGTRRYTLTTLPVVPIKSVPFRSSERSNTRQSVYTQTYALETSGPRLACSTFQLLTNMHGIVSPPVVDLHLRDVSFSHAYQSQRV